MTASVEELREAFADFYKRYYGDEIAKLAQNYPRDQRSLYIDWQDVSVFGRGLPDAWISQPDQTRRIAEECLADHPLPADITMDAELLHVRLANLPTRHSYYPGEFSPTDHGGDYLRIEGEVTRRTDDYAVVVNAAFECQRCGTMTYIPQLDRDEFQEPHECQGCERQGPFKTDNDQSEFIDGQKIRVEEPPERAKGGDASHIDVYVRDDIVGQVESGDRVAIDGVVHLKQLSKQNQKRNRFEPYMDGQAIEIKQTEFEDLDITDEEVEQIRDLADSTNPDIFQKAIDSVAPGVVGEEYENIKLAIFLQMVGGVRTELKDGTVERGDFHVALIGDPGTGKSDIMDYVQELAPLSVSASGKNATAAGITAAAVRDDFSETGEWTIDPGALVQADGGIAVIDELDKMPETVREGFHKAMANQRIPVNKAGINTKLPAKTAILAAANPEKGRWDPDEEFHTQLDLGATLLSRFGLIWRLEDRPDTGRDGDIGNAITIRKDTAKRNSQPGIGGETTAADGGAIETDPLIDPDLLRKYIAYARREVPDPVFADEGVREKLVNSYVTLRGANGYTYDAAVPVTPRKLEDAVRVAEAAARAELSTVITKKHVSIATRLIGASLQSFGTNSDGDFDADIVEANTSKTQEERVNLIIETVKERQPDEGGLAVEGVVDVLHEHHDLDPDLVRKEVDNLLEKGELYPPNSDRSYVRRWT